MLCYGLSQISLDPISRGKTEREGATAGFSHQTETLSAPPPFQVCWKEN